jgi:tetratricopeptide (TPR) repeat protein
MNNWDRIEQIFDEAVELPPAERPAFLEEACQGDPILRAEVESLLNAESAGARVIPEAVSRLSNAIVGDGEADRLGPYRLDRKIGEGGMGAVYLAHRDDDEYRQEVAVKVVRARGQFALSRFRHERQILAALEHPNIARLIDGGTTPAGMPYFVMEYIPGGLSVTQFAEQNHLSQLAKLRLFLKVCAAVQHAHQRLVIHRDIKPANILVTADGEPKLLDFGIAKLLDPERAKGTVLETLTGMNLLTPDYASAEQVRGGPITTSTDVYSLGLVLFELLTGERAQKLTTYSAEEVVRVVCETEPPKPNLGSDLDNILGMALRKEPARRYSTVEQFAEDIQRFLDDRPVLARPDTLSYRVAKFTRRNRWSVALAALLLVALTGGIAATAWQARVASRRFQQVRALANKFVFEVDDELYRIAGTMKARQMLVTTSLQYLDALGAEAAGDRDLSIEIARAYVKVGDVLGGHNGSNLGKTAEAVESWNKAVAIYDKLGTANRDIQGPLALALMRRGNVARVTHKYPEGVADLQKAVALFNAGGGISKDRAYAHCYYGDLLLQLSGPDAALPEMRRCGEVLRAAGESDSDALNRSGNALAEAGRLEEAAKDLERALQAIQKKIEADPHNGRSRREASVAMLNLSGLHAYEGHPSLGDFATALRYMRRSMEIAAELAAQDPNNKEAQQTRTINEVRLAYLIDVGENKASEAEALLRRAIASFEALRVTNPKNVVAHARVGAARLYLAHLLERHNRLSEAAAEAEADIRIQDQLAGPTRDTAITTVRIECRTTLARIYRKQGNLARARTVLAEVAGRVVKGERENTSYAALITRAEFYTEYGLLSRDSAFFERAAGIYRECQKAGLPRNVWEPPLQQIQAELKS